MEIDEEVWFGLKNLQEANEQEKVVKISDDVTQEPNVFKPGEQRYVIHIKTDGGTKMKVSLNASSLANLVRGFGKESVNWIGREVILKQGSIKGKDAMLVMPKL